MSNAIPTAVAAEFTRVLKSWLSPGEWSDMISKNKNDPAYANGACASQDYCDANEAMIEAFRKHKLPLPGDLGDEDVAPVPFRIWNDAWALARKQWPLAAEYVALIGYDPFEDDPTITVAEVERTIAEYKAIDKAERRS